MFLVTGAEEIGIDSETGISETKGAETWMDSDMGVSEYGEMITGGSVEIGIGWVGIMKGEVATSKSLWDSEWVDS